MKSEQACDKESIISAYQFPLKIGVILLFVNQNMHNDKQSHKTKWNFISFYVQTVKQHLFLSKSL